MPQHGLSCPDHAENSHASRFPVPRKGGRGLPTHGLHKMPNLLAVSTLLTYSDTTLAHSQRQARGSTANGKVNIWTRTRHRTEILFKIEKSYINSLYLSPFKVHYKSCLKIIAIRARLFTIPTDPPSGVSAGHIYPQLVPCNFLGGISFPLLSTGVPTRLRWLKLSI